MRAPANFGRYRWRINLHLAKRLRMNHINHSLNDNTDCLYSISQLGLDLIELLTALPKSSELTSGLMQRVAGYISDEVSVE